MYLEIVSPEATLFSGEVESVIVPRLRIAQMLNSHAPLFPPSKRESLRFPVKWCWMMPFKDKFKKQDDNTTLFQISSGTVEMRNNKLILLAD